MTRKEISDIISKAKDSGYNISIKDIGCMLLKKELGDMVLAHQIVFDSHDHSIPAKYEAQQKISHLKKILNDWYLSKTAVVTEREFAMEKIMAKKAAKKNNSEDMTFEENKASLIQMLAEIRTAVEDGDLAKKDALKLETDIRTKLVDKFNTSEEVDKNYIIVNTKMNSICECGREFYNPLEDPNFMKHYHKED